MRIIVASDHAGFDLKQGVLRFLLDNGHEAQDFGTYSAHQGVEHDNMNVLVLGARVIALNFAEELVSAFVKAEFFAHEERYVRRVEKMRNLEARFCGVERIEERLSQRLRAKVR